ncbi:MAG: hypothetical protein ACRC7C_15310 [Beijerinckiaceae bacterium]
MSIVAALVQSVGAVTTAVVAITLWRLKTNADRLDEDRRRRQKTDDIVRAVRADIAVELGTLTAQFDEPHASALKDTLLERLVDAPGVKAEHASLKDMPQGKAAPQSFVFDIVKSDLTIMPAEVIESVVAYYRLDQRLGSLVDAFSAGVYANIADERQKEAVEGLFELGKRTLATAREAKALCDAFLASAKPVRQE